MPTQLRSTRSLSALFSLLAMLLVLGGAPRLLAQAAPDSLTLQAEGPTGILVKWQACQVSTADNCQENFAIYRNPPSLDTLLATQSAGDSSTLQYLDTSGLKPSTKYTYMVCTGEKAKDGSNCLTASATTLAKPPSGGSGGGSGNGSGTPYTNNQPPPTNLRALAGGSTVLLDWQNPPLQFPLPIEIDRALTGATSPGKIAMLQPVGRPTVSDARYADTGPLAPHDTYNYYVCTGTPDTLMHSCARSNPVTIWGVNPVLTAVRTSPTTIKLSVAVDNMMTLTALHVTRQDSSDPCRSGGTLGNGLQGCGTSSYGPNGVPINVPKITTTDYNNPGSTFGASTATAPYVINLPVETVSAGVEYYYVVKATWNGTVQQDSETITVSTSGPINSMPNKMLGTSVAGGRKSVGIKAGTTGRPQDQAPLNARTAILAPAVAAAQTKVKANPNDAQSLYTLGQSYCTVKMHDACVSTMYMGWLQSQKAGNTTLSNQIKTRLAAEGVSVSDQK
ncbi:MAG: hypothetical protein H0X25_12040 [Acidobacteriales bacterium]|nr:hypothetical protein [Terriglobales bacterium]